MSDPYAVLAKYYDLFSPDWEGALGSTAEWLDSLFQPLGVSSILDCTCGTGLQSIALAKKGYVVTGSDVSRPMLRRARQNAQRAGVIVRWIHGDIRSLYNVVRDCFDAVITSGNSLLHLVTSRDLRQALEGMYAVTRKGGYSLIAVADREVGLKKYPPFMSKRVQLPDGNTVSLFTTTEYKGERIKLNIFIVQDTSKGPRVTHRVMQLRMPGRQELLDLLDGVGFAETRNISKPGTVTLLARKT